MKKRNLEEDLEKMKEAIQRKGEEIEQMQKTIEELKGKIREKEEEKKTTKLDDVVGEVSELLETGFGIFGSSGKGQDKAGNEGGLVGLINNLSQLAEKSEEFRKEFDHNGKKGVVDFKVRTGPLRRSAVKPAGRYSIKPPASKKEREDMTSTELNPIREKEPMVDVFEEEDKIIVTAEIPTVKESDIDWELEGDKLTIRTKNTDVEFYKEIHLSARVKREDANAIYRNGVLEISLQKHEKN